MSVQTPSPSRPRFDMLADMGDAPSSVQVVDETERMRASLYRLLGLALAHPPDADFLAAMSRISGGAGEFGDGLRMVAAQAGRSAPAEVLREYDALFIGITHGEIIPYASFYLTGFLYERPLARLRGDMAEFGLALADGRSDPEDHIATIFEVMASLIDGTSTAAQRLERQHAFFRMHIEPWAARLFADLEVAASARLYRPIATLGRLLVALDQEAFLMECT